MPHIKTNPQSSSNLSRFLAAGTFWGGLMLSGVIFAAAICLSS